MHKIKALIDRMNARVVALITAGAYLLLPAIAYADNSDVCGGSGDRCNAFVETYINPVILLLSGLVGVFAVISIIVAGIQYSSSADDPAAVSKAKQRIFNTILGIVAYILLFALLNYLVPGGLI